MILAALFLTQPAELAPVPVDPVSVETTIAAIRANPKFDATITPLLPTYVEFDARVNAACLIQVCLDRAPVLTVVTLRGVVSPEPPPFENP